jgi:formylglycine-generating enzyme required for sulfatase activity
VPFGRENSVCATGYCGNGRCTPPNFQYIPAGREYVGLWDGRPDEGPAHEVALGAFEMMRTEVTQRDWYALTGDNPSYFQTPSCTDGDCAGTENENPLAPVEQVDWYSALAYANELSRRHEPRLPPCYALVPVGCADEVSDWSDGETDCEGVTWPSPPRSDRPCSGYRLPTEAEWEYAIRAGRHPEHYPYADLDHWGENCASYSLRLVAWFCGNSGARTHQAGSRELTASEWGLVDMLGNVFEWVWDWYDAEYYNSMADFGEGSNSPLGPETGSNRVLRGGSWAAGAQYARAAYRFNRPPLHP